MTDGEHGDRSAIRVTLRGDTTNDVDVDALKKWLERERGLEVLVKDNKLRIYERPRDDAGSDDAGPTMGVGMDILLVMTGAVTPHIFDAVLTATKAGVKAWRENRQSVESDPPPVVDVTPHVPPQSGPNTPDNDGE